MFIQRPEYGGGEIWFDDELIRKDGLLVKGDIDALPSETMEKLLRCFDEVFPAIWEKFGAGEKPTIVYEIKRSYKGIAYTAGDHIGLNPGWLVEHPNDIDCMTHELIHAAQGYPHYDPSWLVEGIADYGRDLFGQYNEDAGWHLPRHYRGGKLTVGHDLAVGDPGQCAPDGKLKRRAVRHGRHCKGFPFSGKIFFDLDGGLLRERIRSFVLPGALTKRNPAQLPLISGDAQDTDGSL